jgi:SAM-dependent methyltransferase
MSVSARLLRSWRRHSLGDLPMLIGKNLRHVAGLLRFPRESVSAFDASMGVETEAVREIRTLELPEASAVHAVRYEPTHIEILEAVFRELPRDLFRFTFVDYGCGKGRVILKASELPFARIVGVEISPELCDIAKRNLRERRSSTTECDEISVLNLDALAFELPRTPVICYFFNPFDLPVLAKVVAAIEHSIAEYPRDAYIVYVNPKHARFFDERRPWTVAHATRRFRIYRAKANGTRNSSTGSFT